MKNMRHATILLTTAIIMGWASGGTAGVMDDTLRQLGRGVSNIAVGFIEIPENMLDVQREDGEVAAMSYGLMRGVWRCGVRTAVGAFEILTCPARFEPIVTPEFPARNGVIDTIIESDKLPNENLVEDWEVNELRLKR